MEPVSIQNRHHQHLLGSVARALIHLLEKTQRGVNTPQSFIVVHIGNIDRLLGHGHISSNALKTDRQLQIFRNIQTRLDLRNNRRAVIVDRVQGQTISIEPLANIVTGLQHQLIDVFRFVNSRSDFL